MITSPRHIRLRATALALAATGTLATLAAGLVPTTDLDPGQPFADLLGQWCTVVLLACAAWAWLVTLAVLLEAARAGGPVAAHRRGLPAAYRRLVLSACGLALTGAAFSPALATPGPIHLVPPHVTAVTAVHPAPSRTPEPGSTPPPTSRGDIVVRPGDSLWHLAEERLPRHADDGTIAHTWRRLYAANHDVVGADPDLILPGQRLTRPQAW
ncbi:LysM peptidoglycan-binding domain-containing protein [Nocardioides nematodiphilus]|uniref:LysM peptidoglycan-binding domain-containing protein n=1 Tax=Nocardioides nematodiphilus TaxID=2849669 RepID=UPI001CDA38A5|nr:LysM domain-containing protein [Nocardioides nematodiphilus]MCA1984539.1 LysM peptidoglycan-binding domain-containing protein [Nocardioides nematodiphilus]